MKPAIRTGRTISASDLDAIGSLLEDARCTVTLIVELAESMPADERLDLGSGAFAGALDRVARDLDQCHERLCAFGT